MTSHAPYMSWLHPLDLLHDCCPAVKFLPAARCKLNKTSHNTHVSGVQWPLADGVGKPLIEAQLGCVGSTSRLGGEAEGTHGLRATRQKQMGCRLEAQ